MANRVPIKPGCLCFVLSGAKSVPGVVEPGGIVEAVEYRGNVRALDGYLVLRVWKITNARIEADLAKCPGDWIGCSADYLQPISDPGLAGELRHELHAEIAEKNKQQIKDFQNKFFRKPVR